MKILFENVLFFIDNLKILLYYIFNINELYFLISNTEGENAKYIK